MTIEDLQQLIADGEHRTLELKKTTGELKDSMHTACAFLNTEGGWLIFGVTPNSRKIVGQKVSDDTQRDISNALSCIEPAVDVRPLYIPVPDRPDYYLIALHFEPYVWGKEPYTYHGCPYYRVESTTRQMSRQMFNERTRAAHPKYFAWERKQAEGIDLKDINEERIRGAIRLGVERGRVNPSALTEPLISLLGKLNLLNGKSPNNAAAFLFGTNHYEYPQFKIRMARFAGNDKNAFRDNMQAEGNFFELLDAGMSFFFKHLSQSGKIVGLYREEHLEIPEEALREALINALCHRRWEDYNLTIGIAIYDNRVEIANPGALPPQLTPQTIKKPHDSFPYNPLIAEFLYKSTFLEKWGSGAKRIIDACRQDYVPEPIWKSEMGFVTITFKRANQTNNQIKGMEREQLRQTVAQFIETASTGVTRKEIIGHIRPALPDTQTEAQQMRVLSNLLNEMRNAGIIYSDGKHWHPISKELGQIGNDSEMTQK